MHTLKGNARTHQFNYLTERVHRIEQTYELYQNHPELNWDNGLLIRELDEAKSIVDLYTQTNQQKLGRQTTTHLLPVDEHLVSEQKINHILQLLTKTEDACGPNKTLTDLKQSIQSLGFQPLQTLVDQTCDVLSQLSQALNKPVPNIEITGHPISLSPLAHNALSNTLIHIFTNAMDHGIESPEERTSANKPTCGRIGINITLGQDNVVLHITDDGRGLALHKLHQIAVNRQIYPANEIQKAHDIAQLIFHPALSSADQVTDISGRGIGLEAARSFLIEHNMTLEVELIDPLSTELNFTAFQFVITIPKALCMT